MKYFVKFFVVTFLFLICTHAIAEQKIVYLDMKFILNNSKAGKDAQDFLQNTFKANQKKFSEKEKVLKEEEADLIAKNTILSKDEYKKQSDKLREKVAKYQAERRVSLEEISKKRAEARRPLARNLMANASIVVDMATWPTIAKRKSRLTMTRVMMKKERVLLVLVMEKEQER